MPQVSSAYTTSVSLFANQNILICPRSSALLAVARLSSVLITTVWPNLIQPYLAKPYPTRFWPNIIQPYLAKPYPTLFGQTLSNLIQLEHLAKLFTT